MSLKNSDPEFFLKFILKNNLNIQHHEGGFLIKQNISFYGTIIIYPSKLKIYAHLLTQKAMLNNVIFFWKLILKQQKASYFKICLFIFTEKKTIWKDIYQNVNHHDLISEREYEFLLYISFPSSSYLFILSDFF